LLLRREVVDFDVPRFLFLDLGLERAEFIQLFLRRLFQLEILDVLGFLDFVPS